MALDEEAIKSAYDLAVKTRIPGYDVIFVALAKELAIELKAFDNKQAKVFRAL
jgi:predicted nucleic acid-binding protein